MRFVLIHGGFHGAWCWNRVVPELNALGHDAVAIDLPGHGKRANEEVTVETRRQAMLDVVRPGDIWVGHSGGGYDISIAADAAPDKIDHLIFLATSLPIEGRTLIEASGGRPATDNDKIELMTDETGQTRLTRANERGWMEAADFEATWDFFYHDCDEATARWAFDHLTPAPVEYIQETIHLPRFWASDLSRSFIRCLQDRSAPRRVYDNAARRLGVEPLTIDTSHSPFLSKPRELAELFVAATSTQPTGPLLPQ